MGVGAAALLVFIDRRYVRASDL